MPASIVTTDDLREFKMELLAEIKKLLQLLEGAPAKKYFRSGEIMKLLKISPGTLQTLRINGSLPYIKFNNIHFYEVEEIEKIMRVNKIHNNY